MIPRLVADVGNTRIKWGRSAADAVADFATLPHDDPSAWHEQLARWGLTGSLSWVVSGVQPQVRDRLASWIRQRGDQVTIIDSARQLPLRTRLEHPDKAGIDRLLNAVAVNARRPPGVAAVIVDAGSAVTVDYLDADGLFCGGAIFPGLRLMARALHEHTALLPLVEIDMPRPPVPGAATVPAIKAGIYWTVVGGIRAVIDRYQAEGGAASVFLSGGDASLLHPALGAEVTLWPMMTLEGIRLAAEALP